MKLGPACRSQRKIAAAVTIIVSQFISVPERCHDGNGVEFFIDWCACSPGVRLVFGRHSSDVLPMCDQNVCKLVTLRWPGARPMCAMSSRTSVRQ